MLSKLSKLTLFFIILTAVGLIAYAYLGDMSPISSPQSETINVNV